MRSLAAIAGVSTLLSACAGARVAVEPPSAARVYARDEVVRILDSLVAQPEFRSAHWGVLVVHPRSRDTLFAHNAGKLFVPASNTKIVTGATILARLGPDYSWKTRFAATGVVQDSVLLGDLVVFGGGDPTVSDRIRDDALQPLREVADSLAARGIRRIAGRVVPGGNAFPDARWGSGWQWDYLDAGYAAGVDELFFNEGTITVQVVGAAAPGLPPQVITRPAQSYPVVKSSASTESANGGRRLRPAVDLDSLTGEVMITGSVAPSDTISVSLTVRDPAAAYLAALAEALSQRGITVDSGFSTTAVAAESTAIDSLFVYHSPPLRDVLPEMMKPSQNQLAEIFLRTIGLEVTGAGRADSGLRVVRDQLAEWGVAEDGFALRDGSGLTRNNFISPESVARVLWAMRNHEHAQLFMDALPVAGVDGTLRSRMRGTPAEGNVRGKTGTLARASALSGYVTTLDGEELIFSLLCNNFTTNSGAVTGMQNQIGVMLASLRWSR